MPTDVLDRDAVPEDIVETAAPAEEGPRPRRRRRVVVRALIGLVAFLLLGNAAILGSTLFFRFATPAAAAEAEGIANVHPVDDKVIRGAAPGAAGLRDLAAAGVTTVIDLRAEADLESHDELLAELGIERFHLPIRDGQLPTEAQAAELLRIVEEAPGKVFLHCGAGVGRTGAMTAWYLNVTGQTAGAEALRYNLSVGPPSLEQIVFSVTTTGGEYRRPGAAVTVLSRVLDGPRRIWHNLT
ncbi:MAG: fused DSP-PTPase phosphatase/NAD kinase-like protein [Acidimicrobiia bacterium]